MVYLILFLYSFILLGSKNTWHFCLYIIDLHCRKAGEDAQRKKRLFKKVSFKYSLMLRSITDFNFHWNMIRKYEFKSEVQFASSISSLSEFRSEIRTEILDIHRQTYTQFEIQEVAFTIMPSKSSITHH